MFKGCRLWLSFALLALLICIGPGVALANVSSISPTTAAEGAASFTLTVNGFGFGSTSQVTWTPPGGATRTLTRLSQSSTRLTATVLPSDLPDEGTAQVRVTGNGSGGPVSFTITEGDVFTLTPQSITASTNVPFSGSVATLTDSYDNTATGTFTATINWNDGTGTSAGTVTRTDVGTYSVTGSHTWASQFWSTSVKTATAYPASTIPVANNGTTNFASTGTIVVFTGTGYQTLSYTGKTAGTSASFTGVSGWTGSGTLAVGNPITQPFSAVTVTVSENSPGTATATTTSPLAVADGTTYLMNVGPFSTTEGQTYTGSSPFFPGSIYTGAIFPSSGSYRLLVSNGSTSAWYTLYTSGPNNYMYPNSTTGSVIFGDEGQVPYSETLYLNDGTPVASGASTVTVNDAGLSYYSAVNTYHTSEASSTGTIQVGKFLDSYIGGGDHHADFTCTVHWGDGSTDTSVPAVYVSSNTYTVSGSHTYSEEGTYTVTYDVADVGGSTLTSVSTAIVALSDPSVVLSGVAPLNTTLGTPLGTQTLATFTDPAGAEPNDGSHYSASIDWGGSFGTSVGTIEFSAGTFSVLGDVPYSDVGSYTPSITVMHEASTPQSVTDTVTVETPATEDIVPSAGPHGTISPDTTQTVAYGSDSATFTITPDVGYHIADVSVDASSVGAVSSYKFTNVTAGHTILATFAIDTFDITPSVTSAHGTISPDTVQTVDYGSDSATFTITPAAHYHVSDVLVDGSSVGTVTAYKFTNVTASHTISASFALDTFTISASEGPNGLIDPTGDVAVPYGADQTFTITPAPTYHIADVQVDGVSIGASSSVTFSNVDANHTIHADFAIDTFTIVPSALGGGAISPSTTQTVDYGSDSATFTITPDVGHHIVDVLVDGVPQGPITAYKFSNVTADHTISATFAIDTFTIAPSAGPNGQISPATTQTVDYGADATFTITPDTGYHIADVQVDGVSIGASSSVTFSNVDANHTIHADFAIDTFTIAPSAGPNGQISPATTQTVDYGADATFTITPDTGYHVADVTVDGVSTGAVASYTFTSVSANHTIHATFAVDTFTIAPSAGPNGQISPATTQTVDYGSNSATFTITPDTGYHVSAVLIDGVPAGAITSYRFSNVTGNHTISATFAIDTFTIAPSAGPNGQISPSTTETVDYGSDSSTFTITPDAHYHVADVLVDGSSVGTVTAYKFSNVKANHTIAVTFAIDQRTITATFGSHGTVTPSGSVAVDYGSDATFTITPDAHYHVADVLVDGSSVGAVATYTFHGVTADHTISATFAINTYELVPTAGAHGAISPATTQTVDYGTDTTFTMTPDAHYHVAAVLVDGSLVGTGTTYVFHSVSASHTISVSFAIDSFTIHPSAGSHGAISPAADTVVDYGLNATFTVTADSGYHITDVAVDGVSVGATSSYTFVNVTANHTIAASFASNVALKDVVRLGGSTRYATAVAIARDAFPGWTGVHDLVVASGDSAHQPDALTAAGLAGAYNAPLLLVPTNYLDPDVRAAIAGMPSGLRVHIVGGTPSVSAKVANLIAGISRVKSVDRYSGADRYATGVAVATKMHSLLGNLHVALITDGANTELLLDPLVASTVSVSRHYPVLLVKPNEVPAVTKTALGKLGVTRRFIVGNTTAVSESVRTGLGVAPGDRISGADVRGDAVAFALRAKTEGWLVGSTVGFAAAVPDAATGGAYMGRKSGPILLVFPGSVPTPTSDYLTNNKATISGGHVFGDTNAISETVRATLKALIN